MFNLQTTKHDIVEYLRDLSDSNDFTILGDLNLPDVHWDRYYGTSSQSQQFADLAYDLNLTQLVSNPTHKAGNLLDMVLTNTDVFYDIQTLTNLPTGLYSDHFMIVFYTRHTRHFVFTVEPLKVIMYKQKNCYIYPWCAHS